MPKFDPSRKIPYNKPTQQDDILKNRYFMAAERILAETERLLVPRPTSIALFGSFTSASLHDGSDIDLLIVSDEFPARPYEKAQKLADEVLFSHERRDFDRVGRKTQESIELLLKGQLLQKGIEPAKTHDLRDLADFLSNEAIPASPDDLTYLSEERIPSFYGAADFIPDLEYDTLDGERCLNILRAFGLLEESQ